MINQDRAARRAEALAAYDAGIPSTLPESNRFKLLVEHHRWGRHGDIAPTIDDPCPVCARIAGDH